MGPGRTVKESHVALISDQRSISETSCTRLENIACRAREADREAEGTDRQAYPQKDRSTHSALSPKQDRVPRHRGAVSPWCEHPSASALISLHDRQAGGHERPNSPRERLPP